MIGVVGGKPGEMNPHLLSKRPRKTNHIDVQNSSFCLGEISYSQQSVFSLVAAITEG